MKIGIRLSTGCVLVGVLAFAGCASTPKKPVPDLAHQASRVVQAPFDAAWQATRDALRKNDYIIYTRDKRGVFVAYSEKERRMRRRIRNELTITLEAVTSGSTRITLAVQQQKFGVTLLTYPGWHDRKTADGAVAEAFFEALESELQERPHS